MGWEAWLTLTVVMGCFAMMAFTWVSPDIIMSAGLTLLLVTGVLLPGEALAGFSNQGMLTVAVLYVVVSGLTETGAVGWIVQNILGRPCGLRQAQARLMTPAAILSAFLNNTPVVAVFVPAAKVWARRNNLSLSRLLIPLSYASIAGGTCTLIGTSTNLVVNGLLVVKARVHSFIVTLGTMTIVTGLMHLYSDGGSKAISDYGLRDWLQAPLLPLLPPSVIFTLLLVAGFSVFLNRTAFGRGFFMVGGNPETAWLAGLNRDRYLVLGFVLCSGTAALGGILLWAARVSVGHVLGGIRLLVVLVLERARVHHPSCPRRASWIAGVSRRANSGSKASSSSRSIASRTPTLISSG